MLGFRQIYPGSWCNFHRVCVHPDKTYLYNITAGMLSLARVSSCQIPNNRWNFLLSGIRIVSIGNNFYSGMSYVGFYPLTVDIQHKTYSTFQSGTLHIILYM
jgi:hypothetical protein